MKKIFSLMVIMATAFAFVACEKAANVDDKENPGNKPGPGKETKLATPELSETHDATSITISWNPVSGAESYLVSMPGNNANVTECTYTFSNLNAGTYTIRVKAVGRGYEDSDNAKIVVELTGLTEVDWFEQTLANVTEPVEVDGRVVNPWNGVYFTWKGTGVAEIRAAMFMTDNLEGASDAEIKEQLTDASAVLSYVNSEEGYTAVYEGLTGSTSYTLCTLVKNAEGLECLVKGSITTAEAEASDAAKSWLGNWTASVDQQYVYGTGFINQPVDLNLTIEMLEGESDVVVVYGYSSLGADFPVFGYIYQGQDGENALGIMNQSIVGQEGQYYYTWISYGDFIGGQYDGTQDFMLGEFPAFWLVMSADGNTAECQSNTIKWNSNGDQFKALALGCGGWDGDQGLAFFQDNSGAALPFYSCDVKNVQRSSAAASKASVRNANEFTLTPSIVVSNVYSL